MKHDRNCQKEYETGNRGYNKRRAEKKRMSNRRLILKSQLEIFSLTCWKSARGDYCNVGINLGKSLWTLFRSDYLIIMVLSPLINLNYTYMKTKVNTKHNIKERFKSKLT